MCFILIRLWSGKAGMNVSIRIVSIKQRCNHDVSEVEVSDGATEW